MPPIPPRSEESKLIANARELVGAEVLVVDADPSVHKGMVQVLAPSGLQVSSAPSPEKALELVGNKFFGVIVVDLDTPSPNAGLQLIGTVRERSPQSLVLALCVRKSFDSAVLAFRAGAHDVILKAPDQVDYLRSRIVSAAGDVVGRTHHGAILAEIKEALEDFLKRFMAAERRAVDLEDKVAGRDPANANADDEVRILMVDSDDRLFKAIHGAKGFAFTLAQTGGEALDRITGSSFHIALVGENLIDLPQTMVVSALKAQAPDLIVITYQIGGRLDIVEGSKIIPLVDKFTAASQLGDRLGELAEAHRAKGRERRYLQAFREKHYEFLRKLSELRKKIDKAIEDEKG